MVWRSRTESETLLIASFPSISCLLSFFPPRSSLNKFGLERVLTAAIGDDSVERCVRQTNVAEEEVDATKFERIPFRSDQSLYDVWGLGSYDFPPLGVPVPLEFSSFVRCD